MKSKSKVIRRSMGRQAADILREQILSGELPPKLRLVETELAAELQVSRGTLRSALSELAHQGLVQQVEYTKWQVPDISAKDAWEIYTLRAALEGLGARLATESVNTQKQQLLQKAFDNLVGCVKGNNRDKTIAADYNLHRTIIGLSDHGRLMTQYELVQQQVRRYMTFSTDILHVPGDLIRDHEIIVSAILDGDADKAEMTSKNHNLEECKILHKQISGRDEGSKNSNESVLFNINNND